MYSVMIFLHVLSALLLGAYVVFPFVAGRAAGLSGAALQGFAGLLSALNRVGQFALIVAFLTGGAMVSQIDPMPSGLWMGIAVVLLLIVGAATGMLGSRLKKLVKNSQAGQSTAEDAGKIKSFSWIAAIAVVLAILIMTNPQIL